MLGLLRSVAVGQAVIVGAVLLAAAGLKSHEIISRRADGDTALDAWLGKRGARVGWIAVTVTELVLAVMLLTGLGVTASAAGAAIGLCGATVFLLVSRKRFPNAPCGCFGAHGGAPITAKTVTRSAFLALCAFGAWLGGEAVWTSALRDPAAIAFLVCEVVLVVMLSSNVRKKWVTRPEWMRAPKLLVAVWKAKRTKEYRSLRRQLVSVVPTDVWTDPDNGSRIVLFEMALQSSGNQRYLAVAVRDNGEEIVAGELRLGVTMEGWEAVHNPVLLAAPSGDPLLSGSHV